MPTWHFKVTFRRDDLRSTCRRPIWRPQYQNQKGTRALLHTRLAADVEIEILLDFVDETTLLQETNLGVWIEIVPQNLLAQRRTKTSPMRPAMTHGQTAVRTTRIAHSNKSQGPINGSLESTFENSVRLPKRAGNEAP